MASSLDEVFVLQVSEPKEALPKITIQNIPKAISVDGVSDMMLKKNPNIKRLVYRGHVFFSCADTEV